MRVMFLALHGDQRHDSSGLADLDVVLTEIAGVRDQFFGLVEPLGQCLQVS